MPPITASQIKKWEVMQILIVYYIYFTEIAYNFFASTWKKAITNFGNS